MSLNADMVLGVIIILLAVFMVWSLIKRAIRRFIWFLILTMLAGGSSKAKLADTVQDILNPPAIEQTYNK